jgi:hypothetical protein
VGRELAARDDPEFHGTLWVLRRFHTLGLLPPGGLRESFASLRELGVRLPWDRVNGILNDIGQEPV